MRTIELRTCYSAVFDIELIDPENGKLIDYEREFERFSSFSEAEQYANKYNVRDEIGRKKDGTFRVISDIQILQDMCVADVKETLDSYELSHSFGNR